MSKWYIEIDTPRYTPRHKPQLPSGERRAVRYSAKPEELPPNFHTKEPYSVANGRDYQPSSLRSRLSPDRIGQYHEYQGYTQETPLRTRPAHASRTRHRAPPACPDPPMVKLEPAFERPTRLSRSETDRMLGEPRRPEVKDAERSTTWPAPSRTRKTKEKEKASHERRSQRVRPYEGYSSRYQGSAQEVDEVISRHFEDLSMTEPERRRFRDQRSLRTAEIDALQYISSRREMDIRPGDSRFRRR